MNDADNHELNELRGRIARIERQQRRRGHLVFVAAAFAGVFVVAAPVALSAPEQPVPCSHDDLYCFAAGAAARADQVNSNFETLHAITDDLGAGVVAANANAESRLSKSGGTVSGNLRVTGSHRVGSLTVDAGLPIQVSDRDHVLWNSSNPTPPPKNLGAVGRRLCFSQGGISTTGTVGGFLAPPLCWVDTANGQWRLQLVRASNTLSGICYAQCITW